jgi:uncharacterized protein
MNESLLNKFSEIYPMVRVFVLGDHIYAYDSKSNFLLEITTKEMELLCEGGNCSNEQIIKLKQRGVFAEGFLQKVAPDDDELNMIVEDQLSIYIPRKFVLEITEECTLSCKYCFFSDAKNNRRHSLKKMDEKIALSAIDYYFKIYSDAIKKVRLEDKDKIFKVTAPEISWWGGEPLLNIKLMKKTKKYIETLPWSDIGLDPGDLVYSVVTNFTSLNNEIIDFIIDTDLYLFVSLDGDQKNHDANRIYADGSGSFATVMNNLEYLMNKFPVFCRTRLILQSVLADNTNAISIQEFIRDRFKTNLKSKKILKHRDLCKTSPV